MAALISYVNLPSCPLAAGVAKTVIQVKAPTNQRVKILSWGLYFDGTTSTAVPVQVRLIRQTSAGTSLVAATPVALEPELTEAVQSTAQTGSLTTQTEPTNGGAILETLAIGAVGGMYEVVSSPGQETIIGGGTWFGIECNAPATVNVRGFIRIEE